MKNKGFTLIELLAVIVILGIIMVIATTSVSKSLEESRKRAKFIAAKEITEIAAAYIETETDGGNEVFIENLIGYYLENDVTNPLTGENGGDFSGQKVFKNSDATHQDNYDVNDCEDGMCYMFDGYIYYLN